MHFKPVHQLLVVQVSYNKLKTEIPGVIFIAETGKERGNLISSYIFPLEILFIPGSFMLEIQPMTLTVLGAHTSITAL